VQGFALTWLVPALGEQRLLLLGLVLSCVEQAMLAAVHAKGAALAAVAVGSLAGVSWPAISAIKANNCGADEQVGRRAARGGRGRQGWGASM
jgi:fucose permease